MVAYLSIVCIYSSQACYTHGFSFAHQCFNYCMLRRQWCVRFLADRTTRSMIPKLPIGIILWSVCPSVCPLICVLGLNFAS